MIIANGQSCSAAQLKMLSCVCRTPPPGKMLMSDASEPDKQPSIAVPPDPAIQEGAEAELQGYEKYARSVYKHGRWHGHSYYPRDDGSYSHDYRGKPGG